MFRFWLPSTLFAAFIFLTGSDVQAAGWQWSILVKSVIPIETNKAPRAFLWIPPICKTIKAAVVGQHNMLEKPVLDQPAFRARLAKLCVADVWITPGVDGVFRFDQGAGEKFDEMMESLAEESGYMELESAFVIPIGHFALDRYPLEFCSLESGAPVSRHFSERGRSAKEFIGIPNCDPLNRLSNSF